MKVEWHWIHLWMHDANHSSYIKSTTFHLSYIIWYIKLNEKHIDKTTVQARHLVWGRTRSNGFSSPEVLVAQCLEHTTGFMEVKSSITPWNSQIVSVVHTFNRYQATIIYKNKIETKNKQNSLIYLHSPHQVFPL